MSVTDGPTVQEVEALNRAMSGGGGGAPGGDIYGGGGAPDMSWAMPQQPDRNALAAMMAQRQPQQRQPQGNPYAGLGGAGAWGGGGGGGGVPDWLKQQQARDAEWIRMNEAADPFNVNQYFGPPVTQSGSITDTGWMYALQPWQGGVTSGGQPGTATNSGWLYGGGATRAEPNYWANQFSTGTGGLSVMDYQRFSDQVGAAAAQEWVRQGGVGSLGFGGLSGGGIAGGMGPGAAGFGGGQQGQGPGGSNNNNVGYSGYSNAGYNPGDVSRGPDLGAPSTLGYDPVTGTYGPALGEVGVGINGWGAGATGFQWGGLTGLAPDGYTPGVVGDPTSDSDGFAYGGDPGGAW